jgi:hypothetical protein
MPSKTISESLLLLFHCEKKKISKQLSIFECLPLARSFVYIFGIFTDLWNTGCLLFIRGIELITEIRFDFSYVWTNSCKMDHKVVTFISWENSSAAGVDRHRSCKLTEPEVPHLKYNSSYLMVIVKHKITFVKASTHVLAIYCCIEDYLSPTFILKATSEKS